MNLLEFLNLGVMEVLIILVILIVPAILTIYCLVDIFRAQFVDNNSRILFLLLVLLVPIIGSILYLAMRSNYVKPKIPPFNQFP